MGYASQQSTSRITAVAGLINAAIANGYTPQAVTASDDAVIHDTIANLALSFPPSVSVSWTPTAVSADTSAEQTVTVTGAKVGDLVVVSPPGLTAGTLMGGARVSAANTVAVSFANVTAGSLSPKSGTYVFHLIRL